MLKASSTQETTSQPSDTVLCHDEQEEEFRVSLQLPLLSEEEYSRMQMKDLGAGMSLAEYTQVTVKCPYFSFCSAYVNLLRLVAKVLF